jgi:hypothetical protein
MSLAGILLLFASMLPMVYIQRKLFAAAHRADPTIPTMDDLSRAAGADPVGSLRNWPSTMQLGLSVMFERSTVPEVERLRWLTVAAVIGWLVVAFGTMYLGIPDHWSFDAGAQAARGVIIAVTIFVGFCWLVELLHALREQASRSRLVVAVVGLVGSILVLTFILVFLTF